MKPVLWKLWMIGRQFQAVYNGFAENGSQWKSANVLLWYLDRESQKLRASEAGQ